MIIPFKKSPQETTFWYHRQKLILIALALMITSYFYLDIPLAKHLEHVSSSVHQLSVFLTDLISPFIHYLIWPTLYFFTRFVWHKSSAINNRILLLAISIPMTNLIVEFLKRAFGRSRPEMLFSQNISTFHFFADQNSNFSFPSGHAATIGALCGALSIMFPRHAFTFLWISCLLAFTRVILDVHYLSDIIAGLLIGVLTAQRIYIAMKKSGATV